MALLFTYDIHFIKFQPLTGNVFVNSDGGIYRTLQLPRKHGLMQLMEVPWPTHGQA